MKSTDELKEEIKKLHPFILAELKNEPLSILKNEKHSTRALIRQILDNKLNPSIYCFLLNNHSDEFKEINLIDDLVIRARQKLVEQGVETSKNKELIKKILSDLEE